MPNDRKLQSLALVLISFSLALPQAVVAQQDSRSKAISRKSLTPGKLDDIVADHLSKIVDGVAKTKATPADLEALKAIYDAAFHIQVERKKFIKTVDDYQSLIATQAPFLDREQAYYVMGNAAAAELRAVKRFDIEWNSKASQLNLRYDMINFEVTSWQTQAHDVVEPILNKPKLMGMTPDDLKDLEKKLSEHGRHLDAALAGLKNAIVSNGGDIAENKRK